MTQTKPTESPGTTVTGIDISAYLTHDAKRSIAFYRDVLGLEPSDADERGAEFTLADGATFGVWDPQDPGQNGSVVMFAVGDIAAAVELLRSRGATLGDPIETPVCFMSEGKDPDGNGFIVHQRKITA